MAELSQDSPRALISVCPWHVLRQIAGTMMRYCGVQSDLLLRRQARLR